MALIVCVIGNLTEQPDCDAIVNSANSYLIAGSGVCGAIHKAAGPDLEEASKKMAPLGLGEAVITKGFALPNKWVVHVRGPVYYKDANPPEALARCIRNALLLADEHKVRCIGFPAISTGVYGYPMEEAAPVMMEAARGTISELKHIEEIRFVVTNPSALAIFNAA